MRIAIDMDEVLADTGTAKRALYAERGFAPSDDALRGHKIGDLAPPEMAAEIEGILKEGVIFALVEPMAGAQAALAQIVQDHEVFIATAAMEYPASCSHKVAWMARHFPMVDRLNIVLCGDKSILRADVLIDDSPRHFDGFAGVGVCYSQLHNHGAEVPHRLGGWGEAPALMARIEKEIAA